jgi:hypothetical protein
MEPLATPTLIYRIRKWVGLKGQGLEGQGLEGQGLNSKTCTIVIGGRVRSGKSYAAVDLVHDISNIVYMHSDDMHDYYVNLLQASGATVLTYPEDIETLPIPDQTSYVVAEPYWNMDHTCNIHPHILKTHFSDTKPNTTLIQTTQLPFFFRKDLVKYVDYLILARESWMPNCKRIYATFGLERIFGSFDIFYQIYDQTTSRLFDMLVIHLSCSSVGASSTIADAVFWHRASALPKRDI